MKTAEQLLRAAALDLAKSTFNKLEDVTAGVGNITNEREAENFYQEEFLRQLGYMIRGKQAQQNTVIREAAQP